MTDRPSSDPLVTIVMYHFVRPVAASRFPRLAGLELSSFREQLRYVSRYYSPIRLRDIIAAAEGARTLPARPIVLTFDDGYGDHYRHVLPLLVEHGIPGAFFPVRSALIDRRVLDVNKVQFILATVTDVAPLIGEIDAAIEASRDPALQSAAEYRAKWWIASRFDGPDVVYVKRMLQHALPDSVRRPLVDTLFRRFVSTDEAGFAADLYLTIEQSRAMLAAGMEFGGHGDRHIPLTVLGPEAREQEIDGALHALDALGVSRKDFAFSYVKGEYDAAGVRLLRERGCGLAVTTRVDLARPVLSDLLTLPRIDANDLPSEGNAGPNIWTERALARQ